MILDRLFIHLFAKESNQKVLPGECLQLSLVNVYMPVTPVTLYTTALMDTSVDTGIVLW